jgi:inner membrane protein
VDALSHALIATIVFSASGLTPLIPFAVLGTVIPDTDIFFPAISDRNPSLYLFTHGGIAHSIAGVFMLSLLAYGTVILLAAAAIIGPGSITASWVNGFAAIFAGALLHLTIDVAALPGIPLLAPISDRKYTLGVLPGPSLFLAAAALGFIGVVTFSFFPWSSAILLYGGMVVMYIAFRAAMFIIAAVKLPGWKIPTINPFRWLVIRENPSSYMIRYYTLFNGYSDEAVYAKFRDTGARDLAAASSFPEVRRFLFFSLIVTAERSGSVLILTDPLREKGYLYYPVKYKQVAVKLD